MSRPQLRTASRFTRQPSSPLPPEIIKDNKYQQLTLPALAAHALR